MISFQKYGLEEIKSFLPYFKAEHLYSCDYTLGIKFMWHNYFSSTYAIQDNTLTLKEIYSKDKYSFYYPMGEHVSEMIKSLKEYQLANLTQCLEFCCVDETHLEMLKDMFPHSEYYADRSWSDYLYNNKDFQTFEGGSYSNKRHHVKRFLKNYPEATFRKCDKCDKEKLVEFIERFDESKKAETPEAINEYKEAIVLAKHFDELGFDCFFIEYKGQIIGISICEVINDCVYDHIEKALREYDSIYPYFVQKIANYYKDIVYFNREDDAGDEGLRYSKEDYHPCKMIEKYMFCVKNNLDLVDELPVLKVNDEISLSMITENDKEAYFDLYTDEELNKLWGYDYKVDLGNEPATLDYFYNMVKDDFRKKDWFIFGIKKNNHLIGEVVLGELNNQNECEIGYRIIKKEQNKGIATKSVLKVIEYLKNALKMSGINAKTYKANANSIDLLKKVGFNYTKSDDTFDYYKLTF